MNQVIPGAAVEAAAKAFIEGRRRGDLGDALMAALEAAAPHMLAEAWEAGRDAAYRRGWCEGWRVRYRACIKKGCP